MLRQGGDTFSQQLQRSLKLPPNEHQALLDGAGCWENMTVLKLVFIPEVASLVVKEHLGCTSITEARKILCESHQFGKQAFDGVEETGQ